MSHFKEETPYKSFGAYSQRSNGSDPSKYYDELSMSESAELQPEDDLENPFYQSMFEPLQTNVQNTENNSKTVAPSSKPKKESKPPNLEVNDKPRASISIFKPRLPHQLMDLLIRLSFLNLEQKIKLGSSLGVKTNPLKDLDKNLQIIKDFYLESRYQVPKEFHPTVIHEFDKDHFENYDIRRENCLEKKNDNHRAKRAHKEGALYQG